MTTIKTNISLDELGAKPPHAGEGEPAFRRGYQQGAHYVVTALKEGIALEDIERFVEKELGEWRGHPDTPSFPPEILSKGVE
jgi:hypothetical protein